MTNTSKIQEVIVDGNDNVYCDGGVSYSSHPGVYLTWPINNPNTGDGVNDVLICPYCSCRFIKLTKSD